MINNSTEIKSKRPSKRVQYKKNGNSWTVPLIVAFIGAVAILSGVVLKNHYETKYAIIIKPLALHVDVNDTLLNSKIYYELSYSGKNKTIQINNIELLVPEIDWRPISLHTNKNYSFTKDTIIFDSISAKHMIDVKAESLSFSNLCFIYSTTGEEKVKKVIFKEKWYQIQYNEIGNKDNLPDSIIIRYGATKEILFNKQKYIIYYWPNNLLVKYENVKDTIGIIHFEVQL